MTYVLVAIQGITVIVGTIALGWWLRRRLAARWSTWAWGALAFVCSQLVRVPLLLAISVLTRPYFTGTDANVLFWINFVVLSLTSGLFEETARYIVLRWLAKDARRWDDGVMFGAGHGGIEAILIIGGSVITSIVLLTTGDALLAQLRASAPEQATTLAVQIDGLRNLQWWMPILSIWERVLAITFHIAASLLVLRAVRDRQIKWWGLAIAWHAAFNATALLASRYGGLIASEVALTVLSVVSVYIIVQTAQWRHKQALMSPLEQATQHF